MDETRVGASKKWPTMLLDQDVQPGLFLLTGGTIYSGEPSFILSLLLRVLQMSPIHPHCSSYKQERLLGAVMHGPVEETMQSACSHSSYTYTAFCLSLCSGWEYFSFTFLFYDSLSGVLYMNNGYLSFLWRGVKLGMILWPGWWCHSDNNSSHNVCQNSTVKASGPGIFFVNSCYDY